MSLSVVSASTIFPLTVEEAREQSRITTTDEDRLLQDYIRAAVDYVETCTKRALLTKTLDWKRDRFPDGDTLRLPIAPVQSITSITYIATDGTSTVMASSDYTLDGPTYSRARIVTDPGVSWPATKDIVNAVTVRMVCGSTATQNVPPRIKAALRLLVAHLYECREPVVAGVAVQKVPLSVEALLDSAGWGALP